MLASVCFEPLYAASRSFFSHHRLPIGLQMGVMGPDFLAAPLATLRQIHAIGYRSVEVNVATPDPVLLRKQLDDVGLACTSAMVSGGSVTLSTPDALIEAAHSLRLTDVVLSALTPPGGFKPTKATDIMAAYVEMTTKLSADDYLKTAELLNRQGQALAREGLRLGYHNHNFELRRFGDLSGLEILLSNTDPSAVSFEMDVGWITAGGVDAVALLSAHPGRFTQMHVKEVARGTEPNTLMNIVAAPLGKGMIDWPRVLSAASAHGIQHFYVEQDPPFTVPRSQMIAEAFGYLSQVRMP
ncbi:MAG TPA: sugar phosphate isomerase/epimerase [Sphingobium sp.]|uniref:sugar phosphate isomerase/epimerase family protein n=1 Tax=Sphingobium sp. TaxID=1912891 RepID=UPI002ED630D5